MRNLITQILMAAGYGPGRVLKVAQAANGAPGILVPDQRLKLVEKALWQPKWLIEKRESDVAWLAGADPFDSVAFEGNLLLNEGIAEMWDLIIGAAATAFNNANSYLGVGDSATAAAATDTGLIAAVNEAYVAMEATYPQRTAETVDFRSVFDGSTGNFAWNEFSAANANSDAGDNMNRLVSAQGTKTTGQSWTLTLSITLS